MSMSFHLILLFFIWVLLSASFSLVVGSDISLCPHHFFQREAGKFEQKTDKFWEFKEETNSWVEVELPYDLVSCVNGNCTKVGSIERARGFDGDHDDGPRKKESLEEGGTDSGFVLPLRKRVSLTKMSETSIWVTGESGSIYERFWNDVQWVVAPHDLPISVEHAVSVFIVNHTILALSEAGILYQMQLSENSQPVWVAFIPPLDQGIDKGEKSFEVLIKSGVASHDGERIYFCTKSGTLLELAEIDPPRTDG